jgi:hypothetical protein
MALQSRWRSSQRLYSYSGWFWRRSLTINGPELEMKARRLIDGASFGPATLKALGLAFDQVRAEIAGNFGTTQVESSSSIASAVAIHARRNANNSSAVCLHADQRCRVPSQSGHGRLSTADCTCRASSSNLEMWA